MTDPTGVPVHGGHVSGQVQKFEQVVLLRLLLDLHLPVFGQLWLNLLVK